MDPEHDPSRQAKVCIYCHEPMTTLEKDHLLICPQSYQCPYCDGQLNKQDEPQHSAICRDRPKPANKCQFCGTQLLPDLDLSHSAQCKAAWTCTVCGQTVSVFVKDSHSQGCRPPIVVDLMDAELQCSLCSGFIPDGNFQTHNASLCGKHSIQCQFCRQSILAETESSHLNQCISAWKCPKCNEFIVVSGRSAHQSVCGQPNTPNAFIQEQILLECDICHQHLDYQIYDDHLLSHSLEEKPIRRYLQPTISSQNRSAAKETEIRFRKCEFCETDVKSDELPLHRETCVQRYKCLDCDSYISLPRINEHKAVCSHIRSQNRQRSTGESVHREERPVGSRAIQSDSQPQSRPAASRALEESKSPVNPPEPMVAPHRSPPASSNCHICNRSVNAAEIQDHMVGHRLQQESIVRQKDERRRKIAEMRSFQQSLMNHGIARHANDDAYFSPENYEELLKLDGDYYAPGKGLKVERLSLLQSFRYKGDEIECVICKETILVDASAKMLPCMHVFHAECIDQWVIRVPKCPVDNREIELDIA